MWRSKQRLPRHFLLSKYHTLSRYTRKFVLFMPIRILWPSLRRLSQNSQTLKNIIYTSERNYVSWRPGRAVTMPAPDINCEIKKSKLFTEFLFICFNYLKLLKRRKSNLFRLKFSFCRPLDPAAREGLTTRPAYLRPWFADLLEPASHDSKSKFGKQSRNTFMPVCKIWLPLCQFLWNSLALNKLLWSFAVPN